MTATTKPIAWRLLGTLALAGAVHGAFSLFGLVQGWERIIWISLGLAAAVAVARLAPSRLLLHGWLAGIAVALGTGLPQATFLDQYLASNPQYAAALDPTRDYRLFTLAMIPVLGTVYGVLIGLVAAGLKYLSRRLRRQ